jgi:uncharacterized protein
MKLKSAVLLFVGMTSIVLIARSQQKPVPTLTPSPNNKTLLWEITGKGLTKPSYLFGTMHILCAEDAQLSTNLKTVIRNVDEIFFEVDMDNMQEMMGALQFLRMNDGLKISDILTPEEYRRVKEYFDTHKTLIPFSMMNRFKPYFVSSLIGESMMACPKKNGMEEQIMKESRQYKKNIRGLETIQFQASIFDSIPYEKQAKDLVAYVDSVDNYGKIIQEMVKVYKEQDLTKMDELTTKSDPGMLQYMDILLYDRNRRWAAEIPEYMYSQSTLFAVGAGHLPGDQGVISLLRKQGYTLKPLNNKSSTPVQAR